MAALRSILPPADVGPHPLGAAPRRSRPRGRRRGRVGRRRDSDRHLLAVADPAGQVELGQVGAGQRRRRPPRARRRPGQPSGTSTSPGRRTLPDTLTTSGAGGGVGRRGAVPRAAAGSAPLRIRRGGAALRRRCAERGDGRAGLPPVSACGRSDPDTDRGQHRGRGRHQRQRGGAGSARVDPGRRATRRAAAGAAPHAPAHGSAWGGSRLHRQPAPRPRPSRGPVRLGAVADPVRSAPPGARRDQQRDRHGSRPDASGPDIDGSGTGSGPGHPGGMALGLRPPPPTGTDLLVPAADRHRPGQLGIRPDGLLCMA